MLTAGKDCGWFGTDGSCIYRGCGSGVGLCQLFWYLADTFDHFLL